MTFNLEQVLIIADELEDSESLLNNAFQEQRILARISELQRSKEVINSDYYWRRLEQLVKDFSNVKTGKNA